MSHVDSITVETRYPESSCLERVLRSWADQTPDAIAIAAPGRAPLTYSRLRSQLDHVIGTLNSIGIGRNDRVAMVLPDGPEAAVAFLGVAAAATCAPINPQYRASEFVSHLSNLNAKGLIVQSATDSPAMAVAQKHGIAVIKLSRVLEAEAGVFTLAGNGRSHRLRDGFAEPDDVALVLHTSGTTSRAKLVPLTHANIYAAARKVQAALELSARDRYLNVTPLFYSQGIMLTISSLFAGASVVCTPGFSARPVLPLDAGLSSDVVLGCTRYSSGRSGNISRESRNDCCIPTTPNPLGRRTIITACNDEIRRSLPRARH